MYSDAEVRAILARRRVSGGEVEHLWAKGVVTRFGGLHILSRRETSQLAFVIDISEIWINKLVAVDTSIVPHEHRCSSFLPKHASILPDTLICLRSRRVILAGEEFLTCAGYPSLRCKEMAF